MLFAVNIFTFFICLLLNFKVRKPQNSSGVMCTPFCPLLNPLGQSCSHRGWQRRTCWGDGQFCLCVALSSSGHAQGLLFATLVACFQKSTARFSCLLLLSLLFLLLSTHEHLRAQFLDWTSPQNSTPIYPAATWLPCSHPSYNTPWQHSWSSDILHSHFLPLQLQQLHFSTCLGQNPCHHPWFFNVLLHIQFFRKSFWFCHQNLSRIWPNLTPSSAVTPVISCPVVTAASSCHPCIL